MRIFADTKDEEWPIAITVADIKRVKAHLPQIDLLRIDEGDPALSRVLRTDPLLLVDVIYLVVKPQAESRSVNDEQFGGRLGGPALRSAMTAFWEELSDFFRGAGRPDLADMAELESRILATVVANNQELIRQWELVSQKLQGNPGSTSPSPDAPQTQSIPGNLSTASPESSESTQTPSP